MLTPALIHQCAPQVAPITIEAIVRVESGGNALAIHDNTTGRSYAPGSTAQARALLSALLARRHRVDAGLMQIDSGNFPRLGLNTQSVFDPCANLRAGSRILQSAYRQAVGSGMHGQKALYHAVEAYNSGNLHGAPSYASMVFGSAGKSAVVVHGPQPQQHRVLLQQTQQFAVNWSPGNTVWGAPK